MKAKRNTDSVLTLENKTMKNTLRMTQKEQGYIENKDIYSIEGEVNMLREKIKRKFIASEKSGTLHFGDVNREENFLRKLLNHNRSKKAFIEDHLLKMKLFIQKIDMLEKENERSTLVAQENKHLRQKVKYWKNHALELQKNSSYPKKMDSHIQELEQRVCMLKEELTEAFKREHKLKKVINSLHRKEQNYSVTDSDDTFLKDIMKERNVLETEKESKKRIMYGTDEGLNFNRSDEQVSSTKTRDENTKKIFPLTRSEELPEMYTSMAKILDNKYMSISKEYKQEEQNEIKTILGKRTKALVNDQEIKMSPSYIQQKLKYILQKNTEYTSDEDTDEEDLDKENVQKVDEQNITQEGNKCKLAKVELEEYQSKAKEREYEVKESQSFSEDIMSQPKERDIKFKEELIIYGETTAKDREIMSRKNETLQETVNQAKDKDFTFKGKKLVSENVATPSKDKGIMLTLLGKAILQVIMLALSRKTIASVKARQMVFREIQPVPEDAEILSKERETMLKRLQAHPEDKPTQPKYKDITKAILGKTITPVNEREMVLKEIQAVPEDTDTLYKERETIFKVGQAETEHSATQSNESCASFNKEDILPDETTAPSKEREILYRENHLLPDETVNRAKDKEITLKNKRVIPEDTAAQSTDEEIMQYLSGKTIIQANERVMEAKDIQDIPGDAAFQSKDETIIEEIKDLPVKKNLRTKEMIYKVIQSVPEDKENHSIGKNTMVKEKQPHPEVKVNQSKERETILKEMNVFPTKTISQDKERENTLAASEDTSTQSTERETMFNQMQSIPQDTATQSKESEFLLQGMQDFPEIITLFKGRDLLREEMQVQPIKTATQLKEREITLKVTKFNQKSALQEKELKCEENPRATNEGISMNEKPLDDKLEMMKKEREQMLKDAAARGKNNLSEFRVTGKPYEARWPQIMNINENKNILSGKILHKSSKEKTGMLSERRVKGYKTNDFPPRENMIISRRKESVRRQQKETQPMRMDEFCTCEKENDFLRQELNFEETTEKTNYKENVIRTETSKVISLKYKRETTAVECQTCQEINNMIHDLFQETDRKKWKQKLSFTNKTCKEYNEEVFREYSLHDTNINASILQYENELQEVEQETEQLINIVQDLLEALGTSFKLLQEDETNEDMN